MATLMDQLLTREPNYVPTADLTKTQAYLQEQGYLPPSYEVNGEWDEYAQSAFRRATRDAYDEHLNGNHVAATPTENAFKFLGNLMPGPVFQGLVGTAKGLIEQVPETIARGGSLESGGALGGAAEGAVIGGVVGGVPGAVVGGLIGASVGFLADFLGDDETEGEDRSLWADFWDSLTPWEEYKKGSEGFRNFMEDLGAITTAASLVSGGKFAAGAFGRAGAQMGAAQAAGIPAGLMTNVQGAAAAALKGGVDDIMLPKLQALVSKPGLGTRLLESTASRFGTGGKAFASAVDEWVASHGLIAQTSRPLLRSVNGTFTGLAGASTGARLFGGFGGSEDLFDKDTGKKSVDLEGTTIAEAIEAAPLPQSPLLDALSFVVFPEKLLPFSGKGIAKAAERALGADGFYKYHIALQQRGASMKPAQIEDKVKKIMGTNENGQFDVLTFLRNDGRISLDAGFDAMVRTRVRARGFDDAGGLGAQSYAAGTEALLKRRYLKEAEEMEGLGDAVATMSVKEFGRRFPTTTEVLSYTKGDGVDQMKGDIFAAAWISDLDSGGRRGLDALPDQVAGERLLDKWRAGGVTVSRKGSGEDAQIVIHGGPKKYANPERDDIAREIERKTKEVTAMERVMGQQADPAAHVAAIDKKKKEIEALVKRRDAAPLHVDTKHEYNLVLANEDDIPNGIIGTTTEQSVHEMRTAFHDARTAMAKARKDMVKGKDVQDIFDAHFMALHDPRDPVGGLIGQALKRKVISQDMATTAIAGLEKGDLKGVIAIETHLKNIAHLKPTRVTLAPELKAMLPAGKTVVAGGSDVITTANVPASLARRNVDEFFANRNLWETLSYNLGVKAAGFGLSPKLNSDAGIFAMRTSSQSHEVQMRLMGRFGGRLPFSGDQVTRKLHEFVVKYNNGDGVVPIGPGEARKKTNLVSGESKTKLGRPLLNVNEMKPNQIKEALDLNRLTPSDLDPDQVAMEIFDALKVGSSLGAEVNLAHPLDTVRMLAKELRVEGMPGFVEFMRTFHLQNPRGAVAAAGGVAGALSGDTMGERLRNAGAGVALGLGGEKLLKKLPPGSYGYLPDKLHRASMAVRYSFSLAFDAGRHVENATLGTLREGLPYALRRDHYVKKRTWKSLYEEGKEITGDEAAREMFHLHEMVTGRSDLEAIDEMMRWMFQRGILGYSPRVQEAASLYMIVQKEGMSLTQVRNNAASLEKRIRMLEGYGIGRRNIEKTVNFFFFPFSFQKKLLTSAGDFLLQAPARAFLVHEGFRRWNESSADEKFSNAVERWLPMADQLKRLNNLAFGVSPGRFFLQGYSDNKSALGRVSQALSSVFVPSGANTPFAQLMGGVGDSISMEAALRNLPFFMPVVVTDETPMEHAVQTVKSFVPAIRDVNNFISGVFEQGQSVAYGGSSFWQLQSYMDEKRSEEESLRPVAESLGYASVQGMLDSSDVGPMFKPEWDAKMNELGSKYRLGVRELDSFENTDNRNKRLLYRLAQEPSRTAAQEDILQINAMVDSAKDLASTLGISQAESMNIVAGNVRGFAMERANDREFQRLYEQFWAPIFGPIRMVA